MKPIIICALAIVLVALIYWMGRRGGGGGGLMPLVGGGGGAMMAGGRPTSSNVPLADLETNCNEDLFHCLSGCHSGTSIGEGCRRTCYSLYSTCQSYPIVGQGLGDVYHQRYDRQGTAGDQMRQAQDIGNVCLRNCPGYYLYDDEMAQKCARDCVARKELAETSSHMHR